MTPERFRAIVEAYGAEPRRWPASERADAQAWAAGHRAEADALLAQQSSLDTWLESHVVAPPDHALYERVIAAAPSAADSRRRKRPRFFWQRSPLWWSGAAIAGVGLAGGLAGAFAVSFFLVTGEPLHEASVPSITTSFGGSSADWSGE
ncbi:hypothetical protein [Paraburkholderia kururiensis]|uniref:Transmembrane protein n=1 Tax=Paraburkholderia kururiensis TaxID=984307 RepID=A0ABZ0WHQ6_9BURK|nr:hypothetical protein [Paraburkholderia kururiensis]WQD76817.1 hypothetical protein U0042_22455 [Paraburkholderia kururiensis]